MKQQVDMQHSLTVQYL